MRPPSTLPAGSRWLALVVPLTLALALAAGGCETEDCDAAAEDDPPTFGGVGDCGRHCERACITGCKDGFTYSWQQARCIKVVAGQCDDGYECDFGPCGGAGQRTCNTAGTGCSACDEGFFYDGGGPCEGGDCLLATLRCQPNPPAKVEPVNPEDLLFLVANDIHQWKDRPEARLAVSLMRGQDFWFGDRGPDPAVVRSFPQDSLTPGAPMPRPLGVLIAGDMTLCDDCTSLTNNRDEIKPFRDLYDSRRTTAAIRLPVYLGLGNHDVTDGGKKNLLSAYIDHRLKMKQGVTNYHSSTRCYSWDWGNTHFIQLHLRASASDGSLPWLQQDLATRVGTSGKKVVIVQHYGWDNFSKEMHDPAPVEDQNPNYNQLVAPNYACVTDELGRKKSCTNAQGQPLTWRWWSYDERVAFEEAIAPYNVVAIFTGHSHGPGHIGADDVEGPGVDVYRGNPAGVDADGGFLVVHLTATSLEIWEATFTYDAADLLTTMTQRPVVGNHWQKTF
jgi:cytolysin (calcineurin-like family phosphatase)